MDGECAENILWLRLSKFSTCWNDDRIILSVFGVLFQNPQAEVCTFWDMLDIIVSSAAPKESQVSGDLEQGQGLRCRHKTAIGLIRINGFARPQGSQIQSNIIKYIIHNADDYSHHMSSSSSSFQTCPSHLFYAILVARWTS